MTEGKPAGPLAIVLADPVLKAGLVELCRTGRVRAIGRRITYRPEQVEPGLSKFEEEIAVKHESIPPEAWEGEGRFLLEYPEALRLEGSRAYVAREPLYMHEAWHDVHFDWNDLRSLVERGKAVATVTRRQPRRDAKRAEIRTAVAALRDMEDWRTSSDKMRRRLVDRPLDKPAGWCRQSTLRRAMQSAEGAPLLPLAQVAEVVNPP
jgi:hypothetical protein